MKQSFEFPVFELTQYSEEDIVVCSYGGLKKDPIDIGIPDPFQDPT